MMEVWAPKQKYMCQPPALSPQTQTNTVQDISLCRDWPGVQLSLGSFSVRPAAELLLRFKDVVETVSKTTFTLWTNPDTHL